MVSGQSRRANCMTSVCGPCVISMLIMRSTPILHRQSVAMVLRWTYASRLGCTMISYRRANYQGSYRSDLLTPAQDSPRRGRSHLRDNYRSSERRRAWLRQHPCRRVCILCPSWATTFLSYHSFPDIVAGSLPATTSILCLRTPTQHQPRVSARGL